jgi:probable HAF family extracellular repeat protein
MAVLRSLICARSISLLARILCGAAAVLLASVAVARGGTFIPLGQFPGGDVDSLPRGVSDEGRVVVGYSRIFSQNFAAFRWTFEEGMVDLGGLTSTDSRVFAHGVNADGSVIVGSSGHFGGRDGFLWTEATGMLGLPNIPGGDQNPLGNINEAIAATPDGATIVGRSGAMAALWPGGGGVVELASNFTHANSISDDGQVIVGWTSGNGWRSDGFGFELLPLRVATDVSADGSVVVGRCRSADFNCPDEAALWSTAGGKVPAGLLRDGDSFSSFEAVSGDGAVAVGWSGSNSQVHVQNAAIIWDEENGLRSLEDALVDDYGIDLGGWRPIIASAISREGMSIAGAAVDASGRIQAFVALLRPQCSDGIDNDGDGDVDLDDGACDGDPEGDLEDLNSVPVPGRYVYLVSKDTRSHPRRGRPKRRATIFGAAIQTPADEILAHDPTVEPTAVVVRGVGGASTGVINLEPDFWSRSDKGLVYREPSGSSGSIRWVFIHSNGSVRLGGRGDAFSPVAADSADGVGVKLRMGDDTYCARFADETNARIWSKRGTFIAIGADAPEGCEPVLSRTEEGLPFRLHESPRWIRIQPQPRARLPIRRLRHW